jgi:hypothetical protein
MGGEDWEHFIEHTLAPVLLKCYEVRGDVDVDVDVDVCGRGCVRPWMWCYEVYCTCIWVDVGVGLW